MATIKELTPFSTAARYVATLPTWLEEYDAQRVSAYAVWEDIYWSQQDAFKVSQLGSDGNPIYVPIAKALIEAINRYLAVDWDFYIDPKAGTPEEQSVAYVNFMRLFKRENVWAKFASQKRYGLIRGDALWHITADPLKPQGRRISMHELDPSTYFPIFDPENADRIVGAHIVELVDVDNKTVVRRQTYRRTVDPSGAVVITSELGLYDQSAWDDRTGKEVKLINELIPPTPLPPGIQQLPIYHIKNMRNPDDPFGSSVLRGLERVIEGINQTITDEDLAIALAGLGVYVTDAGAPVDENGDEVAWQLSPGRVIELGAPGAKFDRVTGVSSVDPSQKHAAYLEDAVNKGASVPAVALGQVDTTTAESGIALFLKLSPLLAANAEREAEMLGVYDQMLYDLQMMWFPAYEQMTMNTILISSVVGDPMPENRSDRIKEIMDLVTAGIMSVETAQIELTKYGYTFQPNEMTLLAAQAQRTALAMDPYGMRMLDEQANGLNDTADGSNPDAVVPRVAS